MMSRHWITVVVLFLSLGLVRNASELDDNYEAQIRAALDFINNNATLQEALKEHLKEFPDDYEGLQSGSLQDEPYLFKWPCTIGSSSEKPTSVHELKPNDVNVVAALGDSITAGNGIAAWTVLGVLLQYRGLSWSIGGDLKFPWVTTLPNILKKYNPDLKGFSTGIGRSDSWNAHLNVAVSGAKAIDLEEQAIELVQRMKDQTDFQNDWKVITLFIGGNDICRYCWNKEKHSPANFALNIRNALDILQAEVPRAFVNVVQTLNASVVSELNEGLICSTLHLFICKCAAYPGSDAAWAEVNQLVVDYIEAVNALINSDRYNVRDDFTVVLQPFLEQTKLPKTPSGKADLSYFAPDCFHFSRRGHKNAAEALWNNMMEPVGSKRVEWTPGRHIVCPPDDHPYFYTTQNSGSANLGDRSPLSGNSTKHDHKNPVDDNSAIIIGAVAGVVCAIVFLLGILYWHHKRRPHAETQRLLGNNEVL